MAKLDGKVALITGAAVGLGEGIATAYAKYGAKLIMVDLDPRVEETAEKLRKEYGSEIVTVVANVADREQMDAAARKAADALAQSLGLQPQLELSVTGLNWQMCAALLQLSDSPQAAQAAVKAALSFEGTVSPGTDVLPISICIQPLPYQQALPSPHEADGPSPRCQAAPQRPSSCSQGRGARSATLCRRR